MKFSATFVATAISVSSTSAFTANLQKRDAANTELMMAKFDAGSFFEEASKFSKKFVEVFSSTFDSDDENASSVETSTTMVAPKADATSLIEEATRISKEFGPTSPEARLAWEAVEEVNASDNSVATMGSLDDECEVENITQECLEYGEALDELQELIASTSSPDFAAQELASQISPVKLQPPDTGAGQPSFQLEKALVEARTITSEKGLASPEAAIAWETVEQIAASGNSNALGGSLSADECFVEAAKEACEALEELHKIVGDKDNLE